MNQVFVQDDNCGCRRGTPRFPRRPFRRDCCLRETRWRWTSAANLGTGRGRAYPRRAGTHSARADAI